MEPIRIVALCILAAILYGIVHDQVTARICVEYFTIGHPPIFQTVSPTLLALGWGVIATWWVGLILGIPVAIAARVGSAPKYDAIHLIRPIAGLLVIMGCASLVAGIAGYIVAQAGWARLVEPLQSLVPASKHSAFLADLWAHLAAYGVGLLGGSTICIQVVLRRKIAAMTRQTKPWCPPNEDG